MNRSRLISIGKAAHLNGLLDLEAYTEAMLTLGGLGDAPSPEDFWVRGGFLGPGDFARALDFIDAAQPIDRPTMPYRDGEVPVLSGALPSSDTPVISLDEGWFTGTDESGMTRVVKLDDEATRTLLARSRAAAGVRSVPGTTGGVGSSDGASRRTSAPPLPADVPPASKTTPPARLGDTMPPGATMASAKVGDTLAPVTPPSGNTSLSHGVESPHTEVTALPADAIVSPRVPNVGTTEARPAPPVSTDEGREIEARTAALLVVSDPARYRPERLLGAGGMGEVHECSDVVLGRRVAVKRLRGESVTDELAVAMLEREARVIGSLEHPNIIPVYDAGYLDETGPFYAMRMMERPSLEAALRKMREADGPALAEYTLNRLLRVFIQVCGAVDYAHSRGVIHCDLKPANILLGSFGEVLVVDWGMAHTAREISAFQGGTPGYMAPEQFEGRPPDARTDVFALGAILYEILTLRPAFPERPDSLQQMRQRRPIVPRDRAPDRAIPDELAEVSLHALESDPAARFQSASEIGTAIETFLEGTRERERREKRATELTEQGDMLADSYEEMLESRPERVAEMSELLASVPPWEAADQKQTLWDAEDRQIVLDSLSIRTFQSSVAAYEQALDEVPSFDGANRGLARLYRAELRRAHERRDDFDRVYFEGLLRQVDPDSSESQGQTTLRLHTTPELVEVTLGHVHDVGRRLAVVREEPIGQSPIEADHLPPGSYVLKLRRPGFFEVLAPVLLRPGQTHEQTIDLRGASDLKPGEVFIAGGSALLGGDETNLRGRELHPVTVPSFYIDAFPVSFHEYFEFLTSQFATDPVAAGPLLPMNTDGTSYWTWTGSDFEPTSRMLRWGDDREMLLSLPAFGLTLPCAEAYARWKSESTGRRYRLPTEDEWEKAARGTDGRRYPWGDRFDSSFCKMRESRSSVPQPEPSGSFALDVSPYGVRDLAGGIAEWVVPAASAPGRPGTMAATRGGAWCDWRVDCAVGARRSYFIEERSARIGFRLVRDVRLGDRASIPPE